MQPPRASLRRPLALALAALSLAAVAADADAQSAEPRRPRLARGEDARDAQSYINCAVSAPDPGTGAACAHWAMRLDPERAEAPFLAYVATWGQDTVTLRRALMLDPFLFQTRFVGSNAKPGQLSKPRARAWAFLRAADFVRASDQFSAYLRSAPGDWESHYGAAIAEHYRGRHDSVVAHLRVVVDSVEGRQAERTTNYVSQDIAEYAIARSWMAAGRTDSARVALERVLAGNLAFPFARQMLGELALAAGDTAAALRESQAALEVAGDDAVVRARHARVLLRVGRAAEAVGLLRQVVDAEPHWVNARRELALALEAAGAGHRDDAIAAWEAFAARAPELPVEHRKEAEAHLAALRARAGSGARD